MTTTNGGENGPRLDATVERLERRADAVELTIRLVNPSQQRAMHYISDVRGIVFDEVAGRFVVRLTDEGREVIPGAVDRLPNFARVDPDSTALLPLRLPGSIVRMRTPAVPTAEVELERHELGPDAEIEVVIGLSDTPFYPDPREPTRRPPSILAWEKTQARCVVPRRKR
jgi:hypothetical protein